MIKIPSYYIMRPDGSLDRSKRNPISKGFGEGFISSFFDGRPIILEEWDKDDIGLDRYVRDLYFSIERDFEEHQIIDRTFDLYYKFKSMYSVHLRWAVYEFFVDFLIDRKRLVEAFEEWNKLQAEEWGEMSMNWSYRDSAIEKLIAFENLFNKPIIRSEHLYRMAPKDSQLTKFGKNNLQEVMQTIDVIVSSVYRGDYIARFFADDEYKISLPREEYIEYFEHRTKFKDYIAWINSKAPNEYCKKDGLAKRNLVYAAMRSEASRLLREGENEYRLIIGAKKIGESWISETELYYKVKMAFENVEVIHHGKPKWLGRQHFDIWFPNHNIAVEYQGAQHDKPVDFFGGEKAFEQNLKRDELKRQKCIENECSLIEVRPGYDIYEVVSRIKKLLSNNHWVNNP